MPHLSSLVVIRLHMTEVSVRMYVPKERYYSMRAAVGQAAGDNINIAGILLLGKL